MKTIAQYNTKGNPSSPRPWNGRGETVRTAEGRPPVQARPRFDGREPAVVQDDAALTRPDYVQSGQAPQAECAHDQEGLAHLDHDVWIVDVRVLGQNRSGGGHQRLAGVAGTALGGAGRRHIYLKTARCRFPEEVV